MTHDLNIFDSSAWEREMGARGPRLGPAAGARDLGCSLYEIDPGGQAVPYHAHHANEELLIVLDGTLELRTPEGTRTVTDQVRRRWVTLYGHGAGPPRVTPRQPLADDGG